MVCVSDMLLAWKLETPDLGSQQENATTKFSICMLGFLTDLEEPLLSISQSSNWEECLGSADASTFADGKG